MAAVEQIVDLKDLPAGTPDPEDVLVYRDVSENNPSTAFKKCTPAQAIINDTTASTGKVYSSEKVDKITRYKGYIVDISDMNDLQPGYSSICRPSTLNIPTPTDYMYGLCTCYEGNQTQGAWKFQVFRTILYDRMYIRRNNTNQGWSAWERLLTESDLKPNTTQITFASGTTTEPQNCTYTVIGKMCIVNISGFSDSVSSIHAIAYGLPKCKTRSNITYSARTLFIDKGTNYITVTGNVSSLFIQLVYAID